MTKVITAMAGGDFTVSMKVKGKDEIAVMGRSVEQFIESMKQMIKKIEEVSGKLKEQADASKNVSGEMNEAAGIQSQSMGEIFFAIFRYNALCPLSPSVLEIKALSRFARIIPLFLSCRFRWEDLKSFQIDERRKQRDR